MPTPGSPIRTGIILGAPLQHLDRAPDLVIAPDDRVELAHARPLGQVQRIFLQRFAAALGFRAADLLAAADRADRLLQRGAVGAVLPQQIAGFALILNRCQKEHLRCDELIAPFLRFLIREIEQIAQFARNGDFPTCALHLGQSLHAFLQCLAQGRHVRAGTLQQRCSAAIFLLQQREQQVLGFDVGIILADRDALRISQRLLKFGGQLVETHGANSSVSF